MFRILAAALLLIFSASSPALADIKRVALILGIGEYQKFFEPHQSGPRRQGDRH